MAHDHGSAHFLPAMVLFVKILSGLSFFAILAIIAYAMANSSGHTAWSRFLPSCSSFRPFCSVLS